MIERIGFRLLVKILILLFSFFTSDFSKIKAQNISVDSLKNDIRIQTSSRRKAIDCFELYRYYSANNIDSAAYFADQFKIYALDSGRPFLIARSKRLEGLMKLNQNDFEGALAQIKEAEKYALEKDVTEEYIVSLQNLGAINQFLFRYDSAIVNYKNGLEYSIKKDLRKYFGDFYESLANVQFVLNRQDSALMVYWEAEKFYIEENKSRDLSLLYQNIAATYDQLGFASKAVEYYQKGLKVAGEHNDLRTKALILTNSAHLATEVHGIEVAIENLQEALTIFENLKDTTHLAYASLSLGYKFSQLKDFKSAEQRFEYAEGLLTQLYDPENTLIYFDYLSDFEKNKGNLEGALDYYQKAVYHVDTSSFKLNVEGTTSVFLETIALLLEKKDNQLYQQLLRGNSITKGKPLLKYLGVLNEQLEEIEDNNLLKKSYLLCSRIEEEQGNVKSAFQYLKKSTEAGQNEQKAIEAQKIARMNVELNMHSYKTDLFQQKIDILNETLVSERSKNKLNYALLFIGFLGVLIWMFIIFYRRNARLSKESKSIKTELESLQVLNTSLNHKNETLRKEIEREYDLNKQAYLEISSHKKRNHKIFMMIQNALESLINKKEEIRISDLDKIKKNIEKSIIQTED